MNLRERFHTLAEARLPVWIAWRRHLHAHPELSFEEHQTMAYVAARLSELGVAHETEVTGTGIVATVRGNAPDTRCLALRADMDALPIQEANEVPYASTVPGVMHACGHDVHTTSLLGAIDLLQATREHWTGSVRCVFQPGEERLPGGALAMVEAGVLENPTPRLILGQHVYPQLPAGHVGMRSGPYMASADEIHVEVVGKGGHAALPHACADAVLATAHMLVAVQDVISRHRPPAVPSVLSFGRVEALGATNVLPDKVVVKGTFRALDESWRFEAHDHIRRILTHTAKAHGCDVDVDIRTGYPYVHNHEATTEAMRRAAVAYLGEGRVHDLDLRMTGEDFSHFANAVPGCFYRLGTADAAGGSHGTAGLHTPRFDVDERALATGAGLMAYAATELLGRG
jgi:amidohydrolase